MNHLLLVVESNQGTESFTLELDKTYEPRRGTKVRSIRVIDLDDATPDPDKRHINQVGVQLRGNDE